MACATATTAFLYPRCCMTRRSRAANAPFAECVPAPRAASMRALRSQRLPLRVRPERCLPALSLLPGHRPAMLQVANRFSATVTQKTAAQAVPVIWAVGGAAVNVLFMNHFQNMAWGHFTVRRLEWRYGHDLVKRAYR